MSAIEPGTRKRRLSSSGLNQNRGSTEKNRQRCKRHDQRYPLDLPHRQPLVLGLGRPPRARRGKPRTPEVGALNIRLHRLFGHGNIPRRASRTPHGCAHLSRRHGVDHGRHLAVPVFTSQTLEGDPLFAEHPSKMRPTFVPQRRATAGHASLRSRMNSSVGAMSHASLRAAHTCRLGCPARRCRGRKVSLCVCEAAQRTVGAPCCARLADRVFLLLRRRFLVGWQSVATSAARSRPGRVGSLVAGWTRVPDLTLPLAT